MGLNDEEGDPLPKNWWTKLQGVSLAELVSSLGGATLDPENDHAWSQKKAEVESFLEEFYSGGFLRVVTAGGKDPLVFPTTAFQLVHCFPWQPSPSVKGILETVFGAPMRKEVQAIFIAAARSAGRVLSKFLTLLAGGVLLLWLAEKVEHVEKVTSTLKTMATSWWSDFRRVVEEKRKIQTEREYSVDESGVEQGK